MELDLKGRKTKRVALCCRVSTSDQNPLLQLDELRAYAERRGWSIVGEYVDQGESGAKDRRPKLDELMARVGRGGVDVVSVWKFSQFARSVRHLVGRSTSSRRSTSTSPRSPRASTRRRRSER